MTVVVMMMAMVTIGEYSIVITVIDNVLGGSIFYGWGLGCDGMGCDAMWDGMSDPEELKF